MSNIFQNIKISTRLFLGFGTLVVLMLVMGFASVNVLNEIERQQNGLVQELQADNYVMEIQKDTQNAFSEHGEYIEGYLAYRVASQNKSISSSQENQENVGKAEAVTIMDAYFSGADEVIDQAMANIEANCALARESLSKIEDIDSVREDQNKILNECKVFTADFSKAVSDLKEAYYANDPVLAEKRMASLDDLAAGWSKKLNQLSDQIDLETAHHIEIVESAIHTGVTTIWVSVTVISAIGLLLAFFFSGSITNLLRRAIDNVSASSEMLVAATQQIEASIQQISASIQQIAAGAQNQASQADQLSKAVSEISSSSQQIASSVDDVNQSAIEASKASQEGGQASEKAVMGLNNVKQVVVNSNVTINKLVEDAKNIDNIVDTITEISEQTNLLALNAAIEAARAGDAGRGFAVVADEIRKLADLSTKSADEIKDLIEEIQGEVKEASDTMTKGEGIVEENITQIGDALTSLERIASMVQQVSGKMQEVSAATQQQASSSQQIVGSVDTLAAISQQSASASQQISGGIQQQSSAIQQISAMAQQLNALSAELQKQVSASSKVRAVPVVKHAKKPALHLAHHDLGSRPVPTHQAPHPSSSQPEHKPKEQKMPEHKEEPRQNHQESRTAPAQESDFSKELAANLKKVHEVEAKTVNG